MKKTFLLSAFCFVLCAFGYTASDVSNANFLSNQWIITSQSSVKWYRLDDTITRAEAVGIALKIKWVTLPNSYTCKNYFTDVKYDATNNWICRAVEIAADEGLISRSNTKFRPSDTITRAEALAIIYKSSILFGVINRDIGWSWQFWDVSEPWQKKLFLNIQVSWIEISPYANNCILKVDEYFCYFYPNRSATRAEVFGFGKAISKWIINNETRVWENWIFLRQFMETPGPEEQFIPKNEISKKFLQQNFYWTNFAKETNFLALSFFALDESLIDSEAHFYYGGLSSSKADLRIVRNMIYARHGRQFESKDLQEFFNSQSWYTINPNYSDALLTEIDLKNISFIQEQESWLKA